MTRYRITDWFVLTAILAAYAFAFAVTPIDYSLSPTLWIAAVPAGLCIVMVVARRRIGSTLVEWRPELWRLAAPFVGLSALFWIAFVTRSEGVGKVPIEIALIGPLLHAYLCLIGSVALGQHGVFSGYRFADFGGPVFMSWNDYQPTLEEGRDQSDLVFRWSHRSPEPRGIWETVDRRIRVPAKHVEAVRQAIAEIEANRAADD